MLLLCRTSNKVWVVLCHGCQLLVQYAKVSGFHIHRDNNFSQQQQLLYLTEILLLTVQLIQSIYWMWC